MVKSNGIDFSVDFCGVRFPNPFPVLLSGSNSAEMVGMAFEAGWGGVCYKTLNSDRIPIIHPSPRMNSYQYEAKQLVGRQMVEQISDRPLKDNLADFLSLKRSTLIAPSSRASWVSRTTNGHTSPRPRKTTGRICWS